jgi:hypothetical protein
LSFTNTPCRWVLIIGARDVRPPSGPCSIRESVAERGGLARALPATLLGFRFLGFFFASRGNAFTSPPSTAFHGPRRITDPQPALLLRARLPRPSFVACPSRSAEAFLRARPAG